MNDNKPDGYLVRPMRAHGVLVLLFLLMAFDFIDRQVLSALLPLIKTEWQLSDTELGSLVSIVNVSIAVLALPTAIVVDRWSRTKSIGAMAVVWSLATGACAISASYVQLLAARFVVGAGEAGYSAGGNALLAAMYPKRLRATVIGIFQSASMIGSVIGVVAGGIIAAHWGWRHAFGIVAIPGAVLALLMFFVRDYVSVKVNVRDAKSGAMRELTVMEMVADIFRSPVLLLVFVGQAAQMLFVATLGNWLPSYFMRFGGLALKDATLRTGIVILLGAIGVAVCGYVIDRLSRGESHRRLYGAGVLALLTTLSFTVGLQTDRPLLIFVGAFFMTSVLGPVMSAVIDFVHPGMRTSTSGAMITSTNLFGMVVGPTAAGMLADRYDLHTALVIVSYVPLLAAVTYALSGLLYKGRRVVNADEPELSAA